MYQRVRTVHVPAEPLPTFVHVVHQEAILVQHVLFQEENHQHREEHQEEHQEVHQEVHLKVVRHHLIFPRLIFHRLLPRQVRKEIYLQHQEANHQRQEADHQHPEADHQHPEADHQLQEVDHQLLEVLEVR